MGSTNYRGHVLAVVGALLGSEGKGVIVNKLADRYRVHVRVGAPNAGHSFFWQGRVWKMQSVPCGWTNPDAILVLGRGALINPKILLQEIHMIQEVYPDIRRRILIDAHAGILDPRFHELEGGIHGEMHQRIGSTGEGVGPARIARISRDPQDFQLAHMVASDWGISDMIVANTPGIIDTQLQMGDNVLLEGTQGSGLSLIHGPWPFVTSTDTNAAQMAADVGISPRYIDRIMLVARTYPIRVAGNSGPLEREITWEELSKRIGKPTTERTTVTKKTRRIGEWDWNLTDRAFLLNKPTSWAITFADYLAPEDEGKTEWDKLSDKVRGFVLDIEQRYNVPVAMVGTGGEGWQVVERGRP